MAERQRAAIMPACEPSLRLHSNGITAEAPKALAAGDRLGRPASHPEASGGRFTENSKWKS